MQELAAEVVRLTDQENDFSFLYDTDESIEAKIEKISKTVYGADGVEYTDLAKEKIADFVKNGWDKLPVCMAKTPLSLTDDDKLKGRPRGFMIHVKDLLNVTGYIRGGCSPIGMKKKYRTFIDEMIELVDSVSVSGGQRGLQITLKPSDLVSFTEATVGDFAVRD